MPSCCCLDGRAAFALTVWLRIFIVIYLFDNDNDMKKVNETTTKTEENTCTL
jgi:hypothetical protein